MPVSEPWTDVEFTLADDESSEFIAVDCLITNTGTDGFLISDYARSVLSPLLMEAGQFWQVSVMGQRYWWLNCMALVEALDRKRTDADWSVVGGEWGSFSWISSTRRLEFRRSRLKRAPILFRIPEYPQGVLFAQETLRWAVVEHGLTGFRFDPVWSAETGGVTDPAGLGLRGVFDRVSAADLEAQRRTARDTLAERESKAGK